MRHRRNSARVALVACCVLVLASCSDDLAVSEPSVATAPSVIMVSGAAKVGEAQPMAGATSATDAVAGDARMGMWWGVTNFELATDLPALDEIADGWRYVARPDLDAGAVARLAQGFGLQGQPEVTIPAEFGGGLRIGPDDGSAPALWFGADAMGWWSYSAPWATMLEAEVVGNDAVAPVEMTPPKGVPTSADAEARARALFAELGIDASSVEFEVYADDWGASVTMWHLLDGRRTGTASSVGFGENAAITWADGYLNSPERVAGFEQVGAAAGFERLAAGGGSWWGGTATTKAEVAMPYPVEGYEGADVTGEPPVITVQIVGVRQAWWPLYDMDGTMWLVPGYVFIDGNGGEHLVPAVKDELIQPMELPTPPPTTPGTDEPAVEPDQGVSNAVAERLLGLDESAAVSVAKESGFEVRVVERDGEQFPATMDYRMDRINVVVTQGVVSRADIG